MKPQDAASRRHQQSCAHALTRNIGQHYSETTITQRNVVIPIAADLTAWQTDATNVKAGRCGRIGWEQARLDRTSLLQLFRHSLSFQTLTLKHSGVGDCR